MSDTRRQQYYVLCAETGDPNPPIALLAIRDREEDRDLALAVYTAPEGEVQQEHLDQFARANEGKQGMISHIALDELLDIMNREAPGLALLDGEEISGSAFKARIQEEFESLMQRRRGPGQTFEFPGE